ncbi:MAG: energy transducer TonB [Gemmatimonadales bacterium]
MRLIIGWGLCACVAFATGCYHSSPHQPAAPPRVVSAMPAPAFPVALQRANVEGEVELVVAIDSAGEIDHSATHVVHSPHELFRRAAMNAVERWQFEPARRDGRATADSVRVRWRFALTDRNCPPPAFPPMTCGTSVGDTAATSAAQHAALEPADGNLLAGHTIACAVATERTDCLSLAGERRIAR